MNERAFPLQSAAAHNGQYGMTLRDYFAAQALTGLIGSGDFLSPAGLFTGGGDSVMAQAAYMLADAMLAERSK